MSHPSQERPTKPRVSCVEHNWKQSLVLSGSVLQTRLRKCWMKILIPLVCMFCEKFNSAVRENIGVRYGGYFEEV